VFKLGRSFCAGLCSRSAAETAAEFGVTEKNGGFRRSFLVGEQSEETASCSWRGVSRATEPVLYVAWPHRKKRAKNLRSLLA
jgi:hypothetical protein